MPRTKRPKARGAEGEDPKAKAKRKKAKQRGTGQPIVFSPVTGEAKGPPVPPPAEEEMVAQRILRYLEDPAGETKDLTLQWLAAYRQGCCDALEGFASYLGELWR